MTNHKPKHFKPLKWEDGKVSSFARVKAPFLLDYHIVWSGYAIGVNGENPTGFRLYTDTDISKEDGLIKTDFSNMQEAKAYAEQHYQNVMAKLEKAIEKLKRKRQ